MKENFKGKVDRKIINNNNTQRGPGTQNNEIKKTGSRFHKEIQNPL